MLCKKCLTSPRLITLRKADGYCENCFISNTNHKFRACIGKNKILCKNEKVLVCLSGGMGSTVLLNLIYNGVTMESHKKLRIIPVFVHLIGVDTDSSILAENVIKQCNNYNFDLYLAHISEYMNQDFELTTINTIPSVRNAVKDSFNFLLKGLSTTAHNDLMCKIQRHLFVKCAEKLKCNFIFTGETTTTLAINLLSNLSLGRGSQVEHDVGFCDSRNTNISIIKPMKEIGLEELNHYSNIKQLSHLQHNQQKGNSLQSVIGAFVIELQENFPATISTVCKTADKLGVYDKKDISVKCAICESNLGCKNLKLTALEATKFSRTVSDPLSETTEDIISNTRSNDNLNGSLFPYIQERLCYGCSRNYSEINGHYMPQHMQMLLN